MAGPATQQGCGRGTSAALSFKTVFLSSKSMGNFKLERVLNVQEAEPRLGACPRPGPRRPHPCCPLPDLFALP